MANPNRTESGRRLARDLKQIREEQGLSIEELHEETKIPHSLIKSFETSGLFEHPMFNRVYLRSFVRTYAELVGVETSRALAALERALEGEYDGGLLRSGDPSQQTQPTPEKKEEAPESGVVQEEGEVDRAAGVSGGRSASEDTPATEESASSREEIGASNGKERTPPESLPAEEEEVADEEWTAASPAGAEPEPKSEPQPAQPVSEGPQKESREKQRGRRERTRNGIPLGTIVGIAAVVLIAVVAVFVFTGNGAPEEEVDDAPDVAAVDPVETDPEAAEPEPAQITLGEEINFTVIAEGGPVQGIRITRDADLRRPYWIEEGEAAVFPASQRIVIEEQLDDIRLLLEGYEYPTDERDDQGRIVITREDAEAFAEQATGGPFELTATPDTNRIPAP